MTVCWFLFFDKYRVRLFTHPRGEEFGNPPLSIHLLKCYKDISCIRIIEVVALTPPLLYIIPSGSLIPIFMRLYHQFLNGLSRGSSTLWRY
jgi:hypothetical protein